MFYATDEQGARIHIDSSIKNVRYVCPCCGGELVRKFGKVNAHHFAHKSRIECDDWYDSKGPWHRYMQSLFREDLQEVPVVIGGVKHIADVKIPTPKGNALIIEFQKSQLTRDKFYERTEFYRNSGARLIWVFDFRKKLIYQDSLSGFTKFGKYTWSHHARFLDSYPPDECDFFFLIKPCTNWDISESYYESDDGDYYHSSRVPKTYGDEIFVHISYQFRNYRNFGGSTWKPSNFKEAIMGIYKVS